MGVLHKAVKKIKLQLSRLETPLHVVLVGLDDSGKSTLLYRLKFGCYVSCRPTVGFNCEKVRGEQGHLLMWDVGGAERVRPLWRSYARGTDALVFVVDANSGSERLEEARVQLQHFSKQQGQQCIQLNKQRPPILVLANKQDLPNAKIPQELYNALGLWELPDTQTWAVMGTSALTGDGTIEAVAKLRTMIQHSKTKHKECKNQQKTKKFLKTAISAKSLNKIKVHDMVQYINSSLVLNT